MNLKKTLFLLAFLVIGNIMIVAQNVKEAGKNPIDAYDLVINGAGLDGYFTAIEAKNNGLKVLLLDKRTSPGYDIVAKRKLWLNEDGIEKWDKSLLDMFFPIEEQIENQNTSLTSPRRSKSDNELLLFAGSLKKEMLRSLLDTGVDVLLMSDVCGIMTDKEDKTTGIVVASKHGVHSIKCGNFIDATDNNLFTRNLFNQKYAIKDAAFILEFEKVKENNGKEIVLQGLGLSNDRVAVHAGKKDKDVYLVEFGFSPKTADLSKIEQQARELTTKITQNICTASDAFSEARLHYTALECSFDVEGKISDKLPVSNYLYIDNKRGDLSCADILQMNKNAKHRITHIPKYDGMRETQAVFYVGGKVPYRESDDVIQEKGFPTMLSKFPVEILKVKTERTPLLVVGGGTAGTMVALAAGEKKTPVTLIEYFNDFGGTKTMAGVNDFYFGYQEHEFIKKLEQERKEFGLAKNLSIGRSTMPRRFYYFDLLKNNNVNMLTGVIMCGVEMDNNRLKNVFVCENGTIRKLETKLTVDATGDADVAYFAGEEWNIGDSRMGITQNYSHWDVAFRPKVKDYNRDYDIINSTEILESQRGLYLAHAEAHYYDFYPMPAIRESRRPTAVYTINSNDILRDMRYDDIISQARSDYDPHYFSSSELSRCGFMLPHFDNEARVNIPYRSIVPQHIDGLLFSGKAIGQTYKALQFTRMSADITVLGYATGLIASEIIKQGVEARNFSVKPVQEELIRLNYLPSGLNEKQQETAHQIVDKLAEGDESFLLRACLENEDEIVPLLIKSFNENKSILPAKALAWFGNSDGIDLIGNELEQNYRKEQMEGHQNTYFEVYDPEILYWKINQNIGLLGMMGDNRNHPLINTILTETASGGSIVFSDDAYTKGRIDLQLVPYYNRIINLCFYIERNPDIQFIAGLEKLLNDEHIRAYKTIEYNKTRWRLYSANLELFLASSSARCGSLQGVDILVDYLDDIHSDFRSFALNELKSITGQDFGYDTSVWKEFFAGNTSLDITPLKKKFEI